MYFGQTPGLFRQRSVVSPTARGIATRPFTPMQRGVPARFAPLPAPMVRTAAPTIRLMPAAWDRRRYDEILRTQGRQAAELARLRAEVAARAQTPLIVATPPTPTAPTVPQISPGSPEADLRPTQDAADGGEAQPEAPSSKKKFIFIGLALVAVGSIGYVVLRKKKPKAA